MIESFEKYRKGFKDINSSGTDINKVASIIDKNFQKYKKDGYAGYEVDQKGGLIVFKLIADGDHEAIYFDPYTLHIHIQNDLWIGEFDCYVILKIVDSLLFVINETNLKELKQLKGKIGIKDD